MTSPRVVYCYMAKCKHYIGAFGPPEMPLFVCEAFPKGIPEDILSGGDPHTSEHEGDGGIRFERKDESDER